MKKLLLTCMIALGITASAQIAVNEGFEAATTPTGWTYTGFSRTTTSGYPCSGTGALRKNLYGTTTNATANAVYTSTSSNGGAIDVAFKYSTRGFSATTPLVAGTMKVEYSADGGTTYNLIGSQVSITTHSALCTSFTGNIAAGAVPSGANFKFRITGTNGTTASGANGDWYLTIDDVTLSQVASCYPPTGLTATGVTSTSATVNWSASTTPPANGYDVYYSTTNTAPTAATVPQFTGVTGLSQTLTGLESNKAYYVWVRSSCSTSDVSAWSGTLTFTTLCGAATLPYTQNFESATVPALPACTSAQNAGTGNNWVTYALSAPNFGFSAGKVLRYSYHATSAANAWFYTQGMNLTAGTTYMIRYRVGGSDVGYQEKMRVAAGTSATSTAMTSPIADNTSIPQGSSSLETVYFTPTTSEVYYIGFNAYSDADMSYLYLDDILVDVLPSCLIPGNPTVGAVTETNAIVNWTAPTTPPAGYDVYYNTTGVAPTATTTPNFENVATLSQQLTGLAAGTNYFVWVRSHCSATDVSLWTDGKMFTTPCPAANYNVPYSQNFENAIAPNLPPCTTRSTSSGNNWLVVNNLNAANPGKTLVYPYSDAAAANAWFFTAGVNLLAGNQYKITYKYGAMSSTYPEKLKVAYGTSATAAGMTTVLNDHPSITNSAPATGSALFTPTADGVYYFGFNAYSAANMYNLIIDDILVDATLATGNNDTRNAVSIYPNPFKDVLNISDVKGLNSISVSDVAGRTVKTAKAASNIDLSELKTGLYIVTLRYEDGSVKSFKAIKK